MTRKHIGRIKVSEYSGVTEFGMIESWQSVNIVGYDIKPEYRTRRKSYSLIYINIDGLNISIGRYNAGRLLVDTIPAQHYIHNLIIDGIDEIG